MCVRACVWWIPWTSRGTEREIRLYDGADISQPLTSITLDASPGLLAPYYDEDTGVLFLWSRVRRRCRGRSSTPRRWLRADACSLRAASTPAVPVAQGDASTSFYEFGQEPAGIYYLTKFETGSLQIGVQFRPKNVLDVKAVCPPTRPGGRLRLRRGRRCAWPDWVMARERWRAVPQIEIAQAFRLSNNQIDLISFTVPRAKVRMLRTARGGR